MEEANDLSGVMNMKKYPIENMESQEYKELLENARAMFKKDGIVTFPQFLLSEAVDTTVREIEKEKPAAWFVKSSHNAFFDGGDERYPINHIRNRQLPTTVATLAYDQLDGRGPLLSLYHSDRFCNFVAQVLDMKEVFRLDDPLGAVNINICPSGTSQNWHFDEAVFSITIMIQKPESGGLFKLTKPIRSCGQENDELYEVMKDVIDKEENMTPTLEFEPGTLSIFCGSECLHKVTETYGGKDRLVAVLCFAKEKGKKNSALVQEKFWGRTVE